jgi:hypothetical protein
MHMRGAGQAQVLTETLSIGFRPWFIRSSRSSGFRINRRLTPSRWSGPHQWLAYRPVTDVPDYSGGTATELHRVPEYWMAFLRSDVPSLSRAFRAISG